MPLLRRSILHRAALAAAMALGLASAAPPPTARAQQPTDLVKEVQARGTLKVGMAESPPWQSPNPRTGEYEGFNVDMAKRVAGIMGV